MLDTTEIFRKKQIEIILSKTQSERAMMGVDMIDSVYEIVKNSIIEKNPELNNKEIICQIFQRYYANDFSQERVLDITEKIKSYHSKSTDI